MGAGTPIGSLHAKNTPIINKETKYNHFESCAWCRDRFLAGKLAKVDLDMVLNAVQTMHLDLLK